MESRLWILIHYRFISAYRTQDHSIYIYIYHHCQFQIIVSFLGGFILNDTFWKSWEVLVIVSSKAFVSQLYIPISLSVYWFCSQVGNLFVFFHQPNSSNTWLYKRSVSRKKNQGLKYFVCVSSADIYRFVDRYNSSVRSPYSVKWKLGTSFLKDGKRKCLCVRSYTAMTPA